MGLVSGRTGEGAGEESFALLTQQPRVWISTMRNEFLSAELPLKGVA